MLVKRRSGGIEQRWLRENHIRAGRTTAARHFRFSGADLFKTTAKMDRRRRQTTLVFPRYGRTQRPIHLEDSKPISKSVELAAISRFEFVARDGNELSRRQIAHDDSRFR